MTDTTGLHRAHTGELGPDRLKAVRALLDDAFDGDFDDHDWDHALGGVHVLLWEEGSPVAHGSLVQRRLLHGGRPLRAGYVEAVAVRADHRGLGHGARVMAEIERLARGAYEIAALGASETATGFYLARGWKRWQGPTFVLAPEGIVRTPEDDDGVHVLPLSAPLDLAAGLVCDWRGGEVW